MADRAVCKRGHILVSIPERVLEALKPAPLPPENIGYSVSIPERVLEALKPAPLPPENIGYSVSIPERVLEALKPYGAIQAL